MVLLFYYSTNADASFKLKDLCDYTYDNWYHNFDRTALVSRRLVYFGRLGELGNPAPEKNSDTHLCINLVYQTEHLRPQLEFGRIDVILQVL
jgi:hypothetical protein